MNMLALLLTVAPPTEPMMDTFLSVLRASEGYVISVNGLDPAGRLYRSNLYTSVPARVGEAQRVEIRTYSQASNRARSVLEQWVVGNGKTLFVYAPKTNTYTSVAYAEDSLEALVNRLAGQSKGFSHHPVRFLRDVASAGTWQTWFPGANRTEEEGVSWFTIGNQDGARQGLKIEKVEGQPIFHWLAYQPSVGSGLPSWTLTIQNPFTPAADLYRFVPPAGAKAVAIPVSEKVAPN